MSIPVSAQVAARPSLGLGLLARVCVAAARLLILLPPSRLCIVLRVLSRGTRPATAAQALSARQATVMVSARCAGLGCTQRSVATALICRFRGRWPDWCTGFRSRPFAAHAWVEVDGVPIGEPVGIAAFHTVLAVRCPAGRP